MRPDLSNGESGSRIGPEEASDEVLRSRGGTSPSRVSHGILFLHHFVDLIDERTPERGFPTQHNVGHHTEGPDIAGPGVIASTLRLENLRSSVSGGSDSRVHTCCKKVTADTPINHLHLSIVSTSLAEDNVFRLKIAVSDAATVRIEQRPSYLLSDGSRGRFVQLTTRRFDDAGEDLSTFAVFHNDPESSPVLIGLKHFADVGVV
mmetsp:Transcript_5437/g.11843  ORF Transcript_5437/g.11843 Transcript_5437/m.11843 type:complete len:205 (+) Transcript_5437:767-1381(+)